MWNDDRPPRPGWQHVELRSGQGMARLPVLSGWQAKLDGERTWSVDGPDPLPCLKVQMFGGGCKRGEELWTLRKLARRATNSYAGWDGIVNEVGFRLDGLHGLVRLVRDHRMDGLAVRSHLWNALWARPYGDAGDVVSFTLVLVIARDECETGAMREMIAVYEELVATGMVADEEGRTPASLRH